MSASLVGSEMCIRDRASPRRITIPPTHHYAQVPNHSIWPTHTQPQPPVSYTHLTLPTICSV
eukprot:6046763-Alexandrium_andersonii.AAC.1